jgi:hypothetical protein
MLRNIARLSLILLLFVTSIALLRLSEAVGSTPRTAGSSDSIQTVRAYLAALNRFLAGGGIDEMEPYLANEALWPSTPDSLTDENLDRVAWLLALRSTFPNLELERVETSTAGDLVIARTGASTGAASLPYWINGGAGPTYPSTIEAFRVQNGLITEHLSATRQAVMTHPLIRPGGTFWLDRPARLTVSELAFTATESKSRYVSVSGPGFVIPQKGQYSVEGDGLLQLASWTDGRSAVVPTGEVAVVSPGQILVISRGHAVLQQAGDQETTLLLMSATPIEPEPHYWEMDAGHQRVETLPDVLRGPPSTERQLWFGAARVLAAADAATEPGLLSMDLTWAIVPPGERLHIDELGYQIAVIELSDGGTTAESSGREHPEIVNTTDQTRVFAIVRTCSSGYDGSRSAACTATDFSA